MTGVTSYCTTLDSHTRSLVPVFLTHHLSALAYLSAFPTTHSLQPFLPKPVAHFHLFIQFPALAIGIGLAVVAGFLIARTGKLRPFIAAGVFVQFVGIAACALLRKDMTAWEILATIQWTVVGQGLWFPANTVATLALTVPEEQAVVVTTLNLCRSLGGIFGVAYSSFILQK